MEKRIKLIYILTILASVALIAAQAYWLFNQYRYSLQYLEDDLFAKTLKAVDADRKLRNELQNKNLHAVTTIKMNVESKANVGFKTETKWNFSIYFIDRKDMKTDKYAVRYDSLYIDSLYKAGKIIEEYRFEVAPHGQSADAYDALDRFLIEMKCPFTTERLDSLLHTEGLTPLSVQIETTDSTVWNADRINHASVFRPTMEVSYPFDILQNRQVRVSYRLNAPEILKHMLTPLICSIILTFLLMFCLIYQINTILRQVRIEELRKNFIHTMIHELKRPITALKLCVSFMKNDKMLQDKEMKEEILRNAHNELDNLSSYFSKLRDMTVDDMENIPLNLSTFKLKALLEECVEKQSLPNDRKIELKMDFENDDFEITADKMHIGNLFCNLLENAVKYSGNETFIRIDCRSEGDKYRLEISDNGMGISEAESAHVFDKFFRSKEVKNRDIPGIGLGLSYVKLLVLAHKGNISLQSALGKGSVFRIEIPKEQ